MHSARLQRLQLCGERCLAVGARPTLLGSGRQLRAQPVRLRGRGQRSALGSGGDRGAGAAQACLQAGARVRAALAGTDSSVLA